MENVITIISVIIAITGLVGIWKMFEKADQPGWAAIVPIYNMYVLTQISGKSILWFFLMFIPFVNVIVAILLSIEVAKRFGKGTGFGLGLTFFGFIFYPILGLGSAQYEAA